MRLYLKAGKRIILLIKEEQKNIAACHKFHHAYGNL